MNKGDTDAQSSRGEIQEGSIISQGAATAPRYKRKDQSSAGTLWKGFPFLCRGDSLLTALARSRQVTISEPENKNNSGRTSRQQLHHRPESKLYHQQHWQPKRSCSSQGCSLSPASERASAWPHVEARVNLDE